jgi:hypothetical protein
MSFATLSDFKTAIVEHLKISASAISASQLSDLVTIAENKVSKHLRVRQMESTLGATAATAGTCAVPTDYLELKFAYINTSPVRKLERKTAEWIYEKYPDRTSGGVEKFVARQGSDFIFGEPSSLGRVMTGSYYAKPTAMSSTINSVFSAYPEVYLFAALSESEPVLGRDTRIGIWESKYQQYVQLANQQDKDEYLSGSVLFTTNS